MAAPLSDSRSASAQQSLSAIRESIARRCEAIMRLDRELEELLQQEGQATIFRFLDLPLTKCFCPMGCCRAVGMLAANLKQLQFGEKMKCLEVLKCINAGERKLIIEALTQPGLGVEVREGMKVHFGKWEHPEQRVPMMNNGDFRAEECSSDQEVILHDARESMGRPEHETWSEGQDRRNSRTAYLRALRRAENA